MINLFEGRFQEAGIEGKVLEELISGRDEIDLDTLINKGGDVGYFPVEYLFFLRVIYNYCRSMYSLALRDLQYLLFTLGSKDNKQSLVL